MSVGEEGFAAMEAIVAAAVVALATGMMFQVVIDGAWRSRALDDERAALLIAQSHLAEAGSGKLRGSGGESGVEGGFVWTTRVVPYRVGGGSSVAGELVQVIVAVRRRDAARDTVVLRSLRLVPSG